ncbi:uncharacterized protein MKK02DRAFT_37485 [Dioszegia hungarica]|uniref:Uncharacterized protein n=1 Tax=Dioszegia hungarica TaxID=4972 RepID=A0AA38LUZ0_9TREE|nr:uncharacterized protein MKK02DRAFT_37485 [Dioszegia hungarica]KAI9634606.1 hypothetical protein MKK02DRAFT_37485 [Dioszegia hungarica]
MSDAQPIAVRYNIGPLHARALPFVLATGHGCDQTPHVAGACRYYKIPTTRSIFITHLRWDRLDIEYSRARVVDLWLQAANMHNRATGLTRQILGRMDVLGRMNIQPAGESQESEDSKRREWYKILQDYINKTELLHVELSNFLSTLVDIESTGRICQELPEPKISARLLPYLSEAIDTFEPQTTWMSQIISNLEKILNDTEAVDDTMKTLESKYNVSFPAIERPLKPNAAEIYTPSSPSSSSSSPKLGGATSPFALPLRLQPIMRPVNAMISFFRPSPADAHPPISKSD